MASEPFKTHRSTVVKLPVSAPRRAIAEFRVVRAASGWISASKNCRSSRQVREDSRRAASPLPIPSASSRHQRPLSVRKASMVSPQTISPSLGRKAAPMTQAGISPKAGAAPLRPVAAAVSRSDIWAYCPLALRRVSSSWRRYCFRSRKADNSPLMACSNSDRWMQRSAK